MIAVKSVIKPLFRSYQLRSLSTPPLTAGFNSLKKYIKSIQNSF